VDPGPPGTLYALVGGQEIKPKTEVSANAVPGVSGRFPPGQAGITGMRKTNFGFGRTIVDRIFGRRGKLRRRFRRAQRQPLLGPEKRRHAPLLQLQRRPSSPARSLWRHRLSAFPSGNCPRRMWPKRATKMGLRAWPGATSASNRQPLARVGSISLRR